MPSVRLRFTYRRSSTTTFHLSKVAASDFDYRRFSSFTVMLVLGLLLILSVLLAFVYSSELALRVRDGVLFLWQLWTIPHSVSHLPEMRVRPAGL